MATTFAVATATTVTAPPTQAANPDVCTPVVVIPLRGSGEGPVGQAGYGWQGPTLDRLLQQTDLTDVHLLQVGAPGYPAVPIPKWSTLNPSSGQFLLDSVAAGTAATVSTYWDFVETLPNYCGLPEVVLVGYSQGAMVARDAAVSLAAGNPDDPNGPVTAVHLIGDPYQVPNRPTNFGGGSNGVGVGRVIFGSYSDRFYDLSEIRTVSLCHDNDPICDTPPDIRDFDLEPHTYFVDDPDFIPGAGLDPTGVTEMEFMTDALSASIEEALSRYGFGPKVLPIKETYAPGETVTAQYAWKTPAPPGAKFSAFGMYNGLSRCSVGLGVVNQGWPTSVDLLDIFTVSVNGVPIQDINNLFDGIPLVEGTTEATVRLTINNANLAKRAVDNFGPDGRIMSGAYGTVEEFDINGNERIDGQEVFAAFQHIIEPYCGGILWEAQVREGETPSTILASWPVGPVARFSMLATGEVPPYHSFTRGQRILVNAAGMSPSTRYSISMRSEPRVLAEVSTNEYGFLYTEITIPHDAPLGEHDLIIQENGGNDLIRKRFSVSAGQPSGPMTLSLHPEWSDPIDTDAPDLPEDPSTPGQPNEPGAGGSLELPQGSLGSLTGIS
ncbi:MAG: cutinase family protein [Dietzia maris]